MKNKNQLRRVKRLCKQFDDDLQSLFDQMDSDADGNDTYETEVYETAVLAQGYAHDAAETEI